jgi:hypothetical protein
MNNYVPEEFYMKKILAVAMVLVLFAALVACEASKGDLTSINDYIAPNYTETVDTGYFTFAEAGGNTAAITGYVGLAEPHAVVIPETVTVSSLGEDVREEDTVRTIIGIDDNAFYYCTAMTSVVIPETVESIGDWAFAGCTSLTEIKLPDAVISIGKGAFHGCDKLTTVDMPANLVSIDDFAFYGCNKLTAVEMPATLTTIGSAAFFGCQSLTELSFPAGITAIGDMAFYKCNYLTAIDMSAITAQKGDIELGEYIFWSDLASIIQSPAEGPVTEYVANIVPSGIGGDEDATTEAETEPEEQTTEAAE